MCLILCGECEWFVLPNGCKDKCLCGRLQDQSLCGMIHLMHVTVSVYMPYMYIMQLFSSCFDQLSCTLSNNPYSLNVLLTSPVKHGMETVSLSLFHILQISSWPEKFQFYPWNWFPFLSPSRSSLTEWQSLLWSKQDADLACSGRAVSSLKLQTGFCRIKLVYLYPEEETPVSSEAWDGGH